MCVWKLVQNIYEPTIMEISADNSHRPIVMIRFNPDNYTDETGKKITSCWKMNEHGILCINKTKKDEWNARIQRLLNEINTWVTAEVEKTVTIVHLFY